MCEKLDFTVNVRGKRAIKNKQLVNRQYDLVKKVKDLVNVTIPIKKPLKSATYKV